MTVSTPFELPFSPSKLPPVELSPESVIVPPAKREVADDYWNDDPWASAPDDPNEAFGLEPSPIPVHEPTVVYAIEPVPDSEKLTDSWVYTCGYDDCETPLTLPGDWVFGGANGLDPRADPRWENYQSVYIYYDKFFMEVFRTTSSICDAQAIDEFTNVAGYGNLEPRYLWVIRPGEKAANPLAVEYIESEDMVYDLKVA